MSEEEKTLETCPSTQSPAVLSLNAPSGDKPVSTAGHTPLPWAVHAGFQDHVVPLAHVKRPCGGSVDPDREAEMYAKEIVFGQGSDQFPQFHRSRVTRAEAKANAALIVEAVNNYAALLAHRAVLREAAQEVSDAFLRATTRQEWAALKKLRAALSFGEGRTPEQEETKD